MSDPDGNMGARYHDGGVFLRYSRNPNVYIIGTETGTKVARSLTRRPIMQRWNADHVVKVTATPWSMRTVSETTVSFEPRIEEPKVVQAPVPPEAPRAMRISNAGLDEHDYTDGCEMCEHFKIYGSRKAGSRHFEACREQGLYLSLGSPRPERTTANLIRESRQNHCGAHWIRRSDAH